MAIRPRAAVRNIVGHYAPSEARKRRRQPRGSLHSIDHALVISTTEKLRGRLWLES